MRDISTEQKLQLTKQVRERYRQDRQDLGQREQLLYGKPLTYFEEEEDYGYEEQFTDTEGKSTVGVRLLLAVVLVCLLALTYRRGDTLFGLTSVQIHEYIRSDYMAQS